MPQVPAMTHIFVLVGHVHRHGAGVDVEHAARDRRTGPSPVAAAA